MKQNWKSQKQPSKILLIVFYLNLIVNMYGHCRVVVFYNRMQKKTPFFCKGEGRNGKGTLIKPFKNALGNYWGDLNMNYYTTYDKGVDNPNQNLYNSRH